VIPPYGSPQRRFSRVLGAYRVNFGGGFAIHGTDEPEKLGRSVTHGCVRLADKDIRALYALVSVGDEVVIF
jgi:lipoprotein-anchoring transpeptidase ErfK/SrfK